MADWPIHTQSRVESSVPTGDAGTQLTSGGTANTKGAWTQLVASTSFDAHSLCVSAAVFTVAVGHLIDIGVGPAGSERVIAPDLLLAMNANRVNQGVQVLPLIVPAGSRIAARSACSTASAACWVNVMLVGPGGLSSPPGLTSMTGYGVVTASSRGTTVDPGGTADTKGAWVALTSSTTAPMRALTLRTAVVNSAPSLSRWRIDLGVGAAGSEVVLMSDLVAGIPGNSSGMLPGVWPALPADIPAGTRLSIRASCSITDATDRLFDAVAYGLS